MSKGERVRLARELKGLTQTELAEHIGIGQPVLAHIESNRYAPRDDIVRQLAFHLGFQPRFFRDKSLPPFSYGSLAYRASAALIARDKHRAHRFGQVAFEIFDALGSHVNQIPVDLPRVHEAPARAARAMRAALNLPPDEPVKNLLRLLERRGVFVFQLPVGLTGVDGYALWAGFEQQRPVLVLTGGRPGDRARWTLSHELRHLSCPPNGTIDDIEEDADQFAAEFLMPKEAMERELPIKVTITDLAKLKLRWGVSIQALVRQCVRIGRVSDRQYRYLMQQIGANGWRTKEPDNLAVEVEKPRALRRMAELVYGNPVDCQRASADLLYPVALLRQIFDAQAGGPTDGRPPAQRQSKDGKTRPALRLAR